MKNNQTQNPFAIFGTPNKVIVNGINEPDGEIVLINDDIIYEIEQVHFLHIIGNIHDNKELLTNGGN